MPSVDGGRDNSEPRGGDGGAAAVVRADGTLAPGPTLLDSPADTTSLLGIAKGRVAGALAPGPIVLERAFRAVGPTAAVTLVETAAGLEANCFGAAALSVRVIRFGAGGFNPVSGRCRFAPPPRLLGATSCEALSGSSWTEGGGGELRIDGRLRIGESGGEIVRVRNVFGDLSVRGTFDGDGIFEG